MHDIDLAIGLSALSLLPGELHAVTEDACVLVEPLEIIAL